MPPLLLQYVWASPQNLIPTEDGLVSVKWRVPGVKV